MRTAGRLIGLDLGSSRIGVAVSDGGQTVATPVDTLRRQADPEYDHRSIADLVKSYDAVGVVVGLPLSLSGAQGPAARRVLAEVESLRHLVGVDVDVVDERLTTVVAAGTLRTTGVRGRRQRRVIDQTAAVLILQTWLDGRSTRDQVVG